MSKQTFKEIAIAATQKYAEQRKEEELRDMANRRTMALRWLSSNGIVISEHTIRENPDDDFIIIDGVSIRSSFVVSGDTIYVRIRGICPDCKRVAWSENASHLWKIGVLIKKFVPCSEHLEECSRYVK